MIYEGKGGGAKNLRGSASGGGVPVRGTGFLAGFLNKDAVTLGKKSATTKGREKR